MSMSVLTGTPIASACHAVAGQQLALALGGGAAVAPHRGDDERLVAHLLERVDGGPGDHGDPVDPPAADPDGDRAARRDALAQPAGADQPADRARDVLDPGLRDRLPDAGQGREGSCDASIPDRRLGYERGPSGSRGDSVQSRRPPISSIPVDGTPASGRGRAQRRCIVADRRGRVHRPARRCRTSPGTSDTKTKPEDG